MTERRMSRRTKLARPAEARVFRGIPNALAIVAPFWVATALLIWSLR